MRRHIEGYKRHLRILQALNEVSVNIYTRHVLQFIEWCEQNGITTDPSSLTRQDVERFLEWCFYQGNANVTRRTKLIAIQKFFRYLLYEGVVQKDITADIPKIRIKWKFVQKFTKNEILRMFREIDITTEKGIRDAAILILGAFAGLRVGEIARLRLFDIVDNGNSVDINITDEIGKQQESRSVYLWKVPSMFIRQLIAIRLAQGAKGDDLLFVPCVERFRVKNKPMGKSYFNYILKEYAKKAGIRKPKITMHMLRATHASTLRHIQGYDSVAIAERLGHKHTSTTDRYLPARGRVRKMYRSLAEYWKEFAHVWDEVVDKKGGDSNETDKHGTV